MKVNSFSVQLNEGLYDPGIFKAFFLAGGPGSGKSFVTSSAFAGTGLKLVNSDVKFERDLKKANLSLKMPDEEAYFRDLIRKSAKKFVITQLDSYIKGRLGLVIVPGFITVEKKRRKESKGRNPRTGEEIIIPAKNVIKFKAGKTLENDVN